MLNRYPRFEVDGQGRPKKGLGPEIQESTRRRDGKGWQKRERYKPD